MNPATASIAANCAATCRRRVAQALDQIGGDVVRRAARGLGERERDVGREIAELGTARRFERDAGGRRIWILRVHDLRDRACERVERVDRAASRQWWYGSFRAIFAER